ncbi:MAG: ATP-binding protein, partial [Egibacteraceae bacterium]
MAELTRERVFGREAQLEQIVSAIDAPGSGVRRPVFVSGSAGIGKTSVVRAALNRCRSGALVAWGTCWHGEGAPGFWPWIQAFADLSRDVGVDAAVDAAGRDRELLSALVRDLGPGPDSADPRWDRVLLLDAARRWIETIAADRAVALVLDDLQWADPSSLELLG